MSNYYTPLGVEHGLNRQPQFTQSPSSTPPAETGYAQYNRPPQQTSPQAGGYFPPPPNSSAHQQPTSDIPEYDVSPLSSDGPERDHEEDHPKEKLALDTGQSANWYAVTAPALAPAGESFIGVDTIQDDVGTFNGGSYRISHKDTNTALTIQLAMGCPLTAKSSAMISMSPSVLLKGSVKLSLKKLIAGAHITHSTFTGPGEVLLGPPMLGDVTTIRLSGEKDWVVGKDAFLACTQGVSMDLKRQGLGKAMFSGEGLFLYKVRGAGIMWITSFGAILRKELVEGERYLVDNGHLVAWNTKYTLERVASGGIMSGLAAEEGLVCKFTGPGTVFLQTRNPAAFSIWMTANASKINTNYIVA